MGYRINSRPDSSEDLMADLKFDLSDLEYELESLLPMLDKSKSEKLLSILESLNFVQESSRILDGKLFPNSTVRVIAG